MASDTVPLTAPQLSQVYAAIEETYRAEGKFRAEYDPLDAPLDAATIIKNFAYVAQRSETNVVDGTAITKGAPQPLVRWDSPINLWTLGASEADKQHIDTLSQRVSELTGLSVSRTRDAQIANLYILVADADERRDLSALIATLGHSNDAPLGQVWPEQVKFPCITRVAIDPVLHTVQWAMILIKGELNGAFRRSCFTEELVQSLGLFNDGAHIRPSIFNDDAEFIELTRHDEYLLEILYDHRLRPGMSRETAEPIVREIATKLLADAKTF
jgi:hypothetical protein